MFPVFISCTNAFVLSVQGYKGKKEAFIAAQGMCVLTYSQPPTLKLTYTHIHTHNIIRASSGEHGAFLEDGVGVSAAHCSHAHQMCGGEKSMSHTHEHTHTHTHTHTYILRPT